MVVVTGAADHLVKVWLYDEGIHTHTGTGHSGVLSKVRVSPDQSKIVSVGAEGAVFIWDMPPIGAVDMISQGYVPHAGMSEDSPDAAAGEADA